MSMKKRFVSLGAVTLVALLGWFLAAFRPAHSELGKLNTQVESTRKQVSSLEAQLRKLIALKNNASAVRAEAARMATALPKTEPRVQDFIRQVQTIADEAGIDFLTVAPSPPTVPTDLVPEAAAPATSSDSSKSSSSGDSKDKPQSTEPVTPLRSISVQVKADGKFFEIENFILKLEHLPRALRIDEFSLSSNQDGSGLLSATMKLQIFMLTNQSTSSGSTAQGTSGAA